MLREKCMNLRAGRAIASAVFVFTVLACASADLKKGVEAMHRGDYREAAREFRACAERGAADCQVNLGSLYSMGKGVRQSFAEAARWFRLAAEQGNQVGQYSLGNAYDRGEGVPRDYQTAAEWYELAAEQGNPEAQNNLAVMYARGEGVPRDYVTAYFWAGVAFKNGNAHSGTVREKIASGMTSKQIAQAERLIREWVPRKPAPRK